MASTKNEAERKNKILSMMDETVASSRSAARVGSIKARLGRTWALGYLAVLLFAVLTVSGLVLAFHYQPTAPEAHDDVVDLRELGALGIFREGHWLAGQAMVIVVFLHLLRVALQRAYRPPRQRNWVVGVVLLGLTLLLAATGTLLPWDQNGYWAIATSVELASNAATLDGPPLDEDALLTVYVLHVLVLPLVVAALVVYHVRRARRDDAREARHQELGS